MARRSLLERLFEPNALRVVFQPVFESGLGGRTHYVESLIRGPEDTTLANPEILFEYARKKQAALAVDRLCIATVLRAARDFVEHAPIGINVHASSLAQDPELLNFIGDNAAVCGVDPSRLVLEIVEHAPPWDVRAFRTGIAGLREIGVKIALDDIGLGHSNFLMVLECRPDYFKIDRYFVAGSHSDYYRRAVLRSVAELARPFGAQVVAEGVETDADLATVREIGIGLVQGYLLARPAGALEIRDRLTGASALPWR